MRILVVASLVTAVCAAITGCHKKLAPHEAERLLAKTYSSATWTARFKCQDAERDWLFICQANYEPTALGLQQGLKPNAVPRVGVRLMGTFDGDPVLAYSELSDGGTALRPQDEHASAQEAGVARRKTEGDAGAGK